MNASSGRIRPYRSAAGLPEIGLLFVYTVRLDGPLLPRGRLGALLPVASALGVTILGIIMTARALTQV